MKIGLVDIEPKVFNTAYMQIAAYHKSIGDEAETHYERKRKNEGSD